MPKLDNWEIVELTNDPFIPPEQRQIHLRGNVTGHPGFVDGVNITTNAIASVHDGFVKTISGSSYEIGEPSAEYEALYPGARNRLFAQGKTNN